jgi:hypothetical protein
MTHYVTKALFSLLLAAALVFAPLPANAQQNPPANQSFVGGKFVARNYAYPGIRIFSGNNASGAATITLSQGSVRLQDGRTIVPFSAGGFNILGQPGPYPAIPITVGAGTTKETVTPTAVSGCYVGAPQGTCSITATFSNAHGQGEVVTSGSAGIQEAINDAAFWGGGVVSIDGSANFYLGGAQTVTAAMAAANVYQGVTLEDDRAGASYWVPLGGASVLAVPTTLTALTALPSTTPVGAFTATAYNMCIAYVDIYGQEGPCSTSFVNTGAGSTSSFIFSAPAASTGAVGYTIYIGLTAAGSTILQYKVPLVTQPTVIGAYPVANGVCTLTTVETITPACAVANTSYGQAGATATVTAITVNTSQIQPGTATAGSTTSIYIPQAGGRTTYTYAQATAVGTAGVTVSNALAFPAGASTNTTVPAVVGTINLAPNAMNQVGRTLEVCGDMTSASTTATTEDVQFQWDAQGQNTAGKGVLLADLGSTVTFATGGHMSFCVDFQTTVASASNTGGSINHVMGTAVASGVSVATVAAAGDIVAAGTVGSLNLADATRLNVIFLHATGTDVWTLQNLRAKFI